MPVPIKPNGVSPQSSKPNSGSSMIDMLDLSFLGNDLLGGFQPKNKKLVQASNKDAALLFDLWVKSDDNKVLNVADLDSKEVLRLKARGFISGGLDKVEFTKKGKAVITTMALDSPNNFLNKKQTKTYNEILASMNKKSNGHGLPKYALNSSNSLNLTAATKPPEIGNPSANDKYIFSERLTSVMGTQYKEYTIRVYLQGGGYHIWGFSGRIGAAKMIPQYKGVAYSHNSAIQKATNLVWERKSKTTSDYVDKNNPKYVPDPNPLNKPGVYVTDKSKEQEALENSKSKVTKPKTPDKMKEEMQKKLEKQKAEMAAKKKAEEEAIAKKKAEEAEKQYKAIKEQMGGQDFQSAFEDVQDVFNV